MTVLRSREILSPKPLPEAAPNKSTHEPVTPVRTREHSLSQTSESTKSSPIPAPPPATRRSLRLASRTPTENDAMRDLPPLGTHKWRRKSIAESEDHVVDENSNPKMGGDEKVLEIVGLSLRSGRRVGKRKMECDAENGVETAFRGQGGRGKQKLVVERVTRGGEKRTMEIEGDGAENERNFDGIVDECGSTEKKERNVKEIVDESGSTSRARRRYSREEKGKEIVYGEDAKDFVKVRVQSIDNDLVDNSLAGEDVGTNAIENGDQKVIAPRMEQFRDIARQNAARFAHFEVEDERVEGLGGEANAEMPAVEEEGMVEDWPGPFSTAMKIIRDRMNKLNSQHGSEKSGKAKAVPIVWVPHVKKGDDHMKRWVPSLQDLSMRILVKNADAITSLEVVPDVLKHRLCQLLCDCRSMNSHMLELLVSGSPTEIRIRDCSWLSEEDFTKCFGACDTSNLTVLQLDQCGRCMPDYILLATLAKSACSLPMLTTLSLSGACRLSDVGLHSLVSSAPSLQSINLSQCSLLTSTSIDILAEALRSVLRELYIDDCQSIDAMLILPALKKLEHLEVLSLSRIQTVCDDFMKEFIVARGHNIKELVLIDCVKLTDSSFKVIADTCYRLCALNLGNLRKLTDSSLGYLANGCHEIHTLKLCRNAFSDEAIAAFVETSGEFLKEISLNNVKQVGHSTALALAKCSKMLVELDLSWCRNLTDEAVGTIVDGCPLLKVLKLFGCTQITKVFLDGHSNPGLQIIGSKMSNLLENVRVSE